MDKIDHNPQGVKIYFNDEFHKYTTDNVKDFTSATTFVGEFFEEFDTENISKRYAIKHELSQDEVKSMWKHEGDIANVKGTNVHDYCESILKGVTPPTPLDDEEELYFRSADKILNIVKQEFELVETEKIIFSEKYKISGMVDLIMKRDDTLLILDWKSNKKIVTDNKWFNYGLGPCKILANNNFMHYTLQLNIYKWLLLQEKYYNCDIKMAIIHILKDSYKVYNIDDLQNIIKEMVNGRLI